MSAQSIFLIGPMGAGKTTVGRRVARAFGLEFVDLDEEIERRCGASVDWVFDIEGEPGFRIRERDALKELTGRRGGLLLATGGGAVLDAQNRRRLAARGLVIYLAATVDQQIRRLRQDKTRPLLRSRDRRARLTKLAEHRNPLYESISDITVETGGSSARTARETVAAIERHRASGSRASQSRK